MTILHHAAVASLAGLLLLAPAGSGAAGAAPAHRASPVEEPGPAGLVTERVELRPAGAEVGEPGSTGVGPGWRATVSDLDAQSVLLVAEGAGREVELAVRLRSHGPEGWSSWIEVHHDPDEAPDPGSEGTPGPVVVGPVWTGSGTDAVEVEVVEGAAAALELEAVKVIDEPSTVTGSSTVVTTSGLASSPTIRPPSAWGSPGWSYATPGCSGGPSHAPLQLALVHHTATTNSYTAAETPAVIRSIYHAHLRNGWCDVAYNFFVDRFGRIWQGRSGSAAAPVVGGHAAGFNTGSVGVALLGQHQPNASPPAVQPTSAQLDAVAEILAWKLSLHGLDPGSTTTYQVRSTNARFEKGDLVRIARIAGHRDTGSTSCPGDHVYGRLGDIRARTASRWAAPRQFAYGVATDPVLWGDWDGDGAAEPAVRRNNKYHLRMVQAGGAADVTVTIGRGSDQAVAGDWDGDGIDTIALYRNGTVFTTDQNSPRPPVTRTFRYGTAGDLLLGGDWDGDGRDGIGVRRGGKWLLRETPSPGIAQRSISFGWPSDVPLVGDWEADGIDTPAVWRAGTVHAAASISSTPATAVFEVGGVGPRTIAGDPTGQGFDMVGVVVGQHWRTWVVQANVP